MWKGEGKVEHCASIHAKCLFSKPISRVEKWSQIVPTVAGCVVGGLKYFSELYHLLKVE